MVNVTYIGRAGNCLFQYVFGRLLAEKNGLALQVSWPIGALVTNFGRVDFDFIKINPHVGGRIINAPIISINDEHRNPTNLTWLEKNYSRCGVHCIGYFQHPAFFERNKALIKSWFDLPAIDQGYKDDVVLHLRLDDYYNVTLRPIIDPSWYAEIIIGEKYKGRKIYVVAQEPKQEWERRYIQRLHNFFDFELVSTTTKEDFEFIRSFGTIICSNSSFCWWAAFLSDAKNIYSFKRWIINSPEVKLQYTDGFKPIEGKYIWE
jgi:hypothetical protein